MNGWGGYGFRFIMGTSTKKHDSQNNNQERIPYHASFPPQLEDDHRGVAFQFRKVWNRAVSPRVPPHGRSLKGSSPACMKKTHPIRMYPCYNLPYTIESAPHGWSAHPLSKGGEGMTVYEALSLMVAFGMFIIAMLSFHKRK
ncbi:putative holin-like toxin [Brevibacillus thermoruber]|jgi:Putative Holin-like Toxin (Hol-Tox)|uniref:putative holin-like toxin n=1 Tax=Brevibacillus thermoruber TaxID=33942 RepID=UPI00404131DA